MANKMANKSEGRTASVAKNGIKGEKPRFCQKLTDADVTASVAPGLPGILDCAVAWGDFDKDGRLDFLIAGTAEDGNVSQLWLHFSFDQLVTRCAMGDDVRFVDDAGGSHLQRLEDPFL